MPIQIDLGFPASSRLQGVPAPEMANCVISVDVVGIVVGTTHVKLSLVQQVSQLSPASPTVFREAVVLGVVVVIVEHDRWRPLAH